MKQIARAQRLSPQIGQAVGFVIVGRGDLLVTVQICTLRTRGWFRLARTRFEIRVGIVARSTGVDLTRKAIDGASVVTIQERLHGRRIAYVEQRAVDGREGLVSAYLW